MTRPPLRALLLLTLGACAQPATDTARPERQATLTLTPTRVDFGALRPGEAAWETVRLEVGGERRLHLLGVALEDAPFSVEPVEPRYLEPGELLDIRLGYAPGQPGAHSGVLELFSDGPASGVNEVLVLGSASGPALQLDAEALDLGAVTLGCSARRGLRLSNIGDAALGVEALLPPSEAVAVDPRASENGALPWRLLPGETRAISLEYAPVQEEALEGALLVLSEEVDAVAVPLTGEGVAAAWQTDRFTQPEGGAVDVLFAVDTSCSMQDEVLSLREALPGFTEALRGRGADYQLALRNDLDGCALGPSAYTHSGFDADAEAQALGQMLSPSSTPNSERAFMIWEAALSAERLGRGGCNEGLVRDDALLVLVGVTDEPEQSLYDYSHYLAIYRALKDDPADLIVYAIAGDYPSGCGAARAATGLYEATVETGGALFSICAEDPGPALDAIAAASTPELRRFPLSAPPVPETLQVLVDGAPLEEGWTWTPEGNALVFDAPPEGGASVEVSYALPGDCGG
ncbi:MAG: hypothetical protein H6741_04625 [Alphaproteobacteria bacterium]|nr:hypothetical protein [Alphaproteobacteria bacterium]